MHKSQSRNFVDIYFKCNKARTRKFRNEQKSSIQCLNRVNSFSPEVQSIYINSCPTFSPLPGNFGGKKLRFSTSITACTRCSGFTPTSLLSFRLYNEAMNFYTKDFLLASSERILHPKDTPPGYMAERRMGDRNPKIYVFDYVICVRINFA